MWLGKPTAAAQRKGPYTTICGFRNPRRQDWGRDHTRPYVASVDGVGSTGRGRDLYTTICGFRDSTEKGTVHGHIWLQKPRTSSTGKANGSIHNRPYMLIFVQPVTRRGAKIWGDVGRGKMQGKHHPRAPMCVH